MCVCVCVCVCVCACVRACMCVCVAVCAHVHEELGFHFRACVHFGWCMFVHVFTCACGTRMHTPHRVLLTVAVRYTFSSRSTTF